MSRSKEDLLWDEKHSFLRDFRLYIDNEQGGTMAKKRTLSLDSLYDKYPFPADKSLEEWVDAVLYGDPDSAELSQEMALIRPMNEKKDIPERVLKLIKDNLDSNAIDAKYKDDVDRNKSDVITVAVKYGFGDLVIWFAFIRDALAEKYTAANMLFRTFAIQDKRHAYIGVYDRPSSGLLKKFGNVTMQQYFDAKFKLLSAYVSNTIMFDFHLHKAADVIPALFMQQKELFGIDEPKVAKPDSILEVCRSIYEVELKTLGKSQYTNRRTKK
jgi:hypothetical protein